MIRPHRLYALALVVLLPACGATSGPLIAPPDADDDDATPWDDQDDDDFTDLPKVPLEGTWIGPTLGTSIFGGLKTRQCEGEAEVTVDEDGVAYGSLWCRYETPELECTWSFEKLRIDEGPIDTVLDCWAEGEAEASGWFDERRLHGRVQMLNGDVLSEIRWDLLPAPKVEK